MARNTFWYEMMWLLIKYLDPPENVRHWKKYFLISGESQEPESDCANALKKRPGVEKKGGTDSVLTKKNGNGINSNPLFKKLSLTTLIRFLLQNWPLYRVPALAIIVSFFKCIKFKFYFDFQNCLKNTKCPKLVFYFWACLT